MATTRPKNTVPIRVSGVTSPYPTEVDVLGIEDSDSLSLEIQLTSGRTLAPAAEGRHSTRRNRMALPTYDEIPDVAALEAAE